MSTLAPSQPHTRLVYAEAAPPVTKWHGPALLVFWIAIFVTSLASPPLLDDADATHAQAAQAMLHTGDWVTLYVDGIRYLEKAPLPYWIAAFSLRLFGENALAVHLPLALAILGLAALGYRWARRSFDPGTAFYTALFLLTAVGPFLFTRVFIPDALLSLLLACGLYALHRTLEPPAAAPLDPSRAVQRDASSGPHTVPRFPGVPQRYALLFWLFMALAVLTKGLIAVVLLLGTAALYLTLTRGWPRWRVLRPGAGILLFLAVAAPWHILAGLRNTGGADGHGFLWFYFVNEHVLRFLGRRIPRDYNKLPTLLYWVLHFVWLFPWSFLLPGAAVTGWRLSRQRRDAYDHACKLGRTIERKPKTYGRFPSVRWQWMRVLGAVEYATPTPAARSVLLLSIFSGTLLTFFAFSTNQEYYTFPAYLPLLLLVAGALSRGRHASPKAFRLGILAWAGVCLLTSLLLVEGLVASRHLDAGSDIGTLLAHRGVGNYTLSLSHFFDLTNASLAALRLPALVAATALSLGPLAALLLLRRQKHLGGALLAVALTSTLFLVAAHLALSRYAPLLSSENFARAILAMHARHEIEPETQVALFGDQSFGSSIPFYLGRPAQIVEGRSTSLLFGSTFPDAPPIFLSSTDLRAAWGHGPRKLLFVPAERREAADRLLGSHSIVLLQNSGKELLTDRPLDEPER